MQLLAAFLTLAVSLGPSFRDATAVGSPASRDQIRVELTVEVAGTPDAVIAHLIDPGNTQETSSLAAKGGGRWGGTVTVDRANLVVVFEAIRGSDSDVSEPATLLDLGLDPALLGSGTPSTQPEDGISEETARWGWIGLALGAGALSLLAFWALGERRPAKEEEDTSELVEVAEESDEPREDEPGG